MKPADFEYRAPERLAEAIALLASSDDAKVLAGGQSLVPLLNFRLARPTLLVDLNKIEGLGQHDLTPDRLVIQAMMRMSRLETSPLVRDAVPVLAAAASWVGHAQIRNRGTVGGTIAHADPAAEIPAIAVLLDAMLSVQGPRGQRTIDAATFFLGFLETDLAPDEILTEVAFPRQDGRRWGFREFAQRHGDFAVGGSAVLLEVDRGLIAGARVVLFGSIGRPTRASAVEAALVGLPASERAIPTIASSLSHDLDAAEVEDGYIRRLLDSLMQGALSDSLGRRT